MQFHNLNIFGEDMTILDKVLECIKLNSKDFDGEPPDKVAVYRLHPDFDHTFEIILLKGDVYKRFCFFNNGSELFDICMQVPYLTKLLEGIYNEIKTSQVLG